MSRAVPMCWTKPLGHQYRNHEAQRGRLIARGGDKSLHRTLVWVSEQNSPMQICTVSQILQRSRRIGDDSPVRLVRLSNAVKSAGSGSRDRHRRLVHGEFQNAEEICDSPCTGQTSWSATCAPSGARRHRSKSSAFRGVCDSGVGASRERPAAARRTALDMSYGLAYAHAVTGECAPRCRVCPAPLRCRKPSRR